jgi:hypothetical protein
MIPNKKNLYLIESAQSSDNFFLCKNIEIDNEIVLMNNCTEIKCYTASQLQYDASMFRFVNVKIHNVWYSIKEHEVVIIKFAKIISQNDIKVYANLKSARIAMVEDILERELLNSCNRITNQRRGPLDNFLFGCNTKNITKYLESLKK